MNPYKNRSGLLFISGSTYHRIPIFRSSKACGIFLHCLEFYRVKYCLSVHAYVLMPDHYHVLVLFPAGKKLPDFLRDFKSMVGRQIVDWLRSDGKDTLLERFALSSGARRARDAKYCVLQYNNYIKELPGGLLWQKINYIHKNPVLALLATTAESYPYSSAGAYLGRATGTVVIEIPK